MSENFHGKGQDFKEIGVWACLRFAVISYTDNEAHVKICFSVQT